MPKELSQDDRRAALNIVKDFGRGTEAEIDRKADLLEQITGNPEALDIFFDLDDKGFEPEVILDAILDFEPFILPDLSKK